MPFPCQAATALPLALGQGVDVENRQMRRKRWTLRSRLSKMEGVTSYAADLSSIRDARDRIREGVHLTPILRSSALDQMACRELFFKCENFQKVGAFKMRGALNAILSLPPEVRKKGVVTHSSGNFAQAVALSAREAGIEARIVMPSNAPRVKVDAVRGYGGKIVFCEPTLMARESAAALKVDDSGGTLLHPFDQDEVIAGQGTVGLELLEQISDLDAVVVPVGGGGLISGIALALSELNPSIRVFGPSLWVQTMLPAPKLRVDGFFKRAPTRSQTGC